MKVKFALLIGGILALATSACTAPEEKLQSKYIQGVNGAYVMMPRSANTGVLQVFDEKAFDESTLEPGRVKVVYKRGKDWKGDTTYDGLFYKEGAFDTTGSLGAYHRTTSDLNWPTALDKAKLDILKYHKFNEKGSRQVMLNGKFPGVEYDLAAQKAEGKVTDGKLRLYLVQSTTGQPTAEIWGLEAFGTPEFVNSPRTTEFLGSLKI
jgi:hypothetical protein